jgi:hypothetical protein
MSASFVWHLKGYECSFIGIRPDTDSTPVAMSKFQLSIDELNPMWPLSGIEQRFPDILSSVNSYSIVGNHNHRGCTNPVSRNEHRARAKRLAKTMGDGIFDERE